MKRKLFLGIDTSNYTTSVSLCAEDGEVIANLKQLLQVTAGERGLRQSDAVFSHVRNLPVLADRLRETLAACEAEGELAAVGCSAYPRDCEGSYMPCFLVGVGVAEMLAAERSVPLYRFSHQAGHVAAAVYSSGLPEETDLFYAFHVSGGTTEILSVTAEPEKFYEIALLGGTEDLNAGQVIDRVGVSLGLPFPAGPSMEQAALRFNGKLRRHAVSVAGLSCHLSGAENLAAAMKQSGCGTEEIAAFVLQYVGDTLFALSENLLREHGARPVVYAGGVMSCSLIKKKLIRENAWFAAPAFSADNAAGIARLTRRRFQRQSEGDALHGTENNGGAFSCGAERHPAQ